MFTLKKILRFKSTNNVIVCQILTINHLLVAVLAVMAPQQSGDGADRRSRTAVAQALLNQPATRCNIPDDSFSSSTTIGSNVTEKAKRD